MALIGLDLEHVIRLFLPNDLSNIGLAAEGINSYDAA